MGNLEQLLEILWKDYCDINPQAEKIHALLKERGETIVNDHIAFRTFNHPRVNLAVFSRPFEFFGYEKKGEYDFPDKKLTACHFEHPDGIQPKIFISELRSDEISAEFRKKVDSLVAEIPEGLPEKWDFPALGRPWRVDFSEYEKLSEESEFGGWLSAFGFRANHFTVSANHLKTFPSLVELNAFLKEQGFELNDAGGEIKGNPQVYLEQSSTLAAPAWVRFTDGERQVPGAYYEFALRHPLPEGELFQGFIVESADKIFESTDRREKADDDTA